MRAAYINAAAVGGLIILLAWLFGEISLLGPLRGILTATRQLADGNLGARAKVRFASSEFHELANSFNTMADRLSLLATTDGLTGVANRRRFDQYLDDEWRRALRSRSEIALAMIDIDGFKLFNDRHGHQIGDECLRLVAAELSRFARRSEDLVGRYGGEEFVIGLPGMSEDDARDHCERIRAAIASLAFPELGLSDGAITISVGLAACVPTIGSLPKEILSRADAALYRAKRAGRNRVAVAGDEPAPSAIRAA